MSIRQYVESVGIVKRDWSNSLFIRFFLALISLALIPMALVAVFAITTYQSLIANIEFRDIPEDLTSNLIAEGILIFAFITIMAFFVAFILSRNITRSLRTLTGAVERVTTGDLDLTFRITRKDEIGQLAQFFHDMIKKLREVTERQQAISRVKSEFISITAHQLRTPLSAMKWALHLFIEGDLGRATKKQLEVMRRTLEENERIIRLVNDLLNVARIEEGRFGYNFINLSINEFVSSIVSEAQLNARQRNINLILEPTEEKFTVHADRERLSLALTNIISNAISYTPAGKSVRVGVTKEKEDYVRISIKDEGMGIREEDKERIFSKFFRGANVVKKETVGSGLGLFITRNIIAQHGGSIWFDSKENVGTTFHFTLPLKKELIPEPTNIKEFTGQL